MYEIRREFGVSLIAQAPFDIIVLHDVAEEINIVGHTHRCHDPENGVSVNARERSGIFFPLI